MARDGSGSAHSPTSSTVPRGANWATSWVATSATYGSASSIAAGAMASWLNRRTQVWVGGSRAMMTRSSSGVASCRVVSGSLEMLPNARQLRKMLAASWYFVTTVTVGSPSRSAIEMGADSRRSPSLAYGQVESALSTGWKEHWIGAPATRPWIASLIAAPFRGPRVELDAIAKYVNSAVRTRAGCFQQRRLGIAGRLDRRGRDRQVDTHRRRCDLDTLPGPLAPTAVDAQFEHAPPSQPPRRRPTPR